MMVGFTLVYLFLSEVVFGNLVKNQPATTSSTFDNTGLYVVEKSNDNDWETFSHNKDLPNTWNSYQFSSA
jgi:hypothetical protein